MMDERRIDLLRVHRTIDDGLRVVNIPPAPMGQGKARLDNVLIYAMT